MKYLINILITTLLSINFVSAQSELVNESFDKAGKLPKGWKEVSTKGNIKVDGGFLKIERKKNSEGKIKSPIAVYTLPVNVSTTKSEVEFSFKASKAFFNTRVDFQTANNKNFISLKLGAQGKYTILYATNNEGKEPKSKAFEANEKLLKDKIVKNKIYTVKLEFTKKKKVNIYVDGELAVKNVALPSSLTAPLSKVKFKFYDAYKGTGIFAIDEFVVRGKQESL
ncbi:hypothetical protein [Flammeovirga sp. SubArs3]|uniref:hypothetical protein n=1 Tax=Flammeovirga sp. SubArs3 TaxID=2995316 RepID=UPI00248BD08A|nr:hypothetical protein [Flammeovirga sp. SubArs3]